MIEFRQLNYFIAVAEELHFGRAAERLHIAQPGLSVQVQVLEKRLGVQLLARSKRSVALTAAGALFLNEARLALRQALHAEAVGKQASRAELGRIAIGYTSSVPFTGILSEILRSFRATHPAVEVTLAQMTAPELFEGLADCGLDFALLRSDYFVPRAGLSVTPLLAGLCVTPLLQEPYVVVLSSSHPLAARDEIDVDDLADEGFISLAPGVSSTLTLPIIEICRRAGFEPRVVQTVTQIATIVSLAAAGLGVAVVPHSLSQLRIADAVFRPLAVDDFSILAFACRRNERAPATLALIQEAKGFATRMVPRPTVGPMLWSE